MSRQSAWRSGPAARRAHAARSAAGPRIAAPAAPSRLLPLGHPGTTATRAAPAPSFSLLAQRAAIAQSARSYPDHHVVGTPGFEPGLSGPPDQRLNQAGPRPVALNGRDRS